MDEPDAPPDPRPASRDLPARTLATARSGLEPASPADDVYEPVVDMTLQAVEWYLEKKRGKRAGALSLRFAAIILTGLAGIVPMLAQIEGSVIAPVWATVLIVGAATAVGIDRFVGYSTAWMRFIRAELRIRTLLSEFELDWEIAKAASLEAGSEPGEVEMLVKAKTFLADVNAIVEAETAEWMDEFTGSLKRIDESSTMRERAGSDRGN